MTYRVKVASLLQASQVMLSRGIEPAGVLEKVGLPPAVLLDGEAWIDRTTGFRLGEEIGHLLSDSSLGLHVMELQKLEQFGALGAGILQATTIGRALSYLSREVDTVLTGMPVGFVDDEQNSNKGRVRLWFEYQGGLGADPRHHVEANLLFIRKILDLAAEPVAALVRLPGAKPRDTGELERLLGPELEFGAERAEFVFDRNALRLQLQNPAPAAMHGRPTATPRETAGAVMRVLRSRIMQERPTAAAIADELGLNVRTMQRHLATWGLTFEMLLNEYRYRHAVEYLHEGQYTITEIAFMLGYSDSAHFTRAFRRWAGHAPRQHTGVLTNEARLPVALA